MRNFSYQILDKLIYSQTCRELILFGDAHWFCPRRNDSDHADYDDPQSAEEDISISDKQRFIHEAERRKHVAYQFSLVFALSSEDVGEWQDAHKVRLTELLSTCSGCIRSYHMGRKKFLRDLSE